MSNPPYLKPYNYRKKQFIMTDVSRHWLGFIMCQEVDKNEPIGIKKGIQLSELIVQQWHKEVQTSPKQNP